MTSMVMCVGVRVGVGVSFDTLCIPQTGHQAHRSGGVGVDDPRHVGYGILCATNCRRGAQHVGGTNS